MTERRAPDRDTFSWQGAVIDKDLTAPPGSPSEGDRYIVGPSATGAWSGHDDDIAEYVDSAWEFYAPAEGWRVDVKDENKQYRYSGAAWGATGVGGTWQCVADWVTITQTGPYVSVSNANYQTLARGVFRGITTMESPTAIKAVIWRSSGSGSIDIRIYDVTNSQTIVEKTGITNEDPAIIQDLGSLSNLPAGASTFEVQVKTTVGTTGRLSAIQFQWG